MKRYDVHLMIPAMTWIGVDAENEEDAIDQCDPVGFDAEMYDFNMTVAIEQTDQEDENGILHS